MRIIQITDPHLGEAGEDTFGVDVRGNFLSVLEAVGLLDPDHIVFTGDLCFRHGNSDIYQWIKLQMDTLEIPYDLISGNHDDPIQIAKVFGRLESLQNGELFYAKRLNDIPTLFLDTTTGVLSSPQMDWLQQQLEQISQDVMLFIHHPPLLGGVKYMDTAYPLQNAAAVQKILFAHPYAITAFCGHYHAENTLQQANVTVHITPSTCYQIYPFTEAFQLDHHRPSFRVIDLEKDKINHTVRYL